MYEAAYQICEDRTMLKAYLYACLRYMNGEEYLRLIQKSKLYESLDEELRREVEEIENQIQVLQYDDTLENWKNQYRRISTGEL